MTTTPAPVRVGLVGAGQWAAEMHAPLHASPGPTELVGVWARNVEQATVLAARHGVRVFTDLADLLGDVEAVDFAVPPAVQARIAVRAADAGRALMLEKPLAADLTGAEEVVRAVQANGVSTLVAMTRRYDAATRAFLERSRAARSAGLVAVSATFVHGGLLPGGFVGAREREGWRAELGMLFDLGSHLLDVVDAAVGPVAAVRADEFRGEAVSVQTFHEDGVLGQLVLSGRVGTDGSVFAVDLLGHGGRERLVAGRLDVPALRATMRREFTDAVRLGTSPTVDAARALHVQRILEAAVVSLRHGGGLEPVRASRKA